VALSALSGEKMSYDNSNQLILKKVVSDNPKAPKLRAEITVNGQKYKASLWPWTKKDGTPVLDKNGHGQYIGDVEVDDWKPQSQSAPEPAPAGLVDDPIPF